VRAFFDRADNHRSAAHVTRLRAQIVRQLLGDISGDSVLDVGAGDGSVTIDLAHGAASLTWLDVSTEMLAAARARITPATADRIHVVEGDLATFEGSFDVVVCIGVLAHVEDVGATIAGLAALTRNGGRLVLELTDHAKLASLPARIAHRLRELVAPHYGYTMNATRLVDVDATASQHGLQRADLRRYWSTPPLMRRFTSAMTRSTFERITMETPQLSRSGASVIALYDKAP